jgi:hypothetical protein
MKEIIDSGEIGEIRHIETHFCVPLPFFSDIRYRFDLAGGATMDTGCYAIHLLRHLAGAEPEVLRAQAIMQSPEVDRRVEADLRFPDGRSGRVVCSLFSRTLLRADARVLGSAGEMKVLNPIAPHLYHRLRVRTPRQRSEKVNGEATCTHQLRAFVRHVRGAAVPTGPTTRSRTCGDRRDLRGGGAQARRSVLKRISGSALALALEAEGADQVVDVERVKSRRFAVSTTFHPLASIASRSTRAWKRRVASWKVSPSSTSAAPARSPERDALVRPASHRLPPLGSLRPR